MYGNHTDIVLATAIGLSIGSFINVLIWRVPRHRPLVGRSRCIHCQTVLPWYDLIPIISYVVRRGRCSTCKRAIPARYPIVELITGVAFAAFVGILGLTPEALRYCTLTTLLITVAEIDRERYVIPNVLLAGFAALAIGLVVLFEWSRLLPSLLSAVVCSLVLLVLSETSRRITGRQGFGMGDVKLLAVVGLYLGWHALWVLYLAAMIGGVIGLLGMLTGRMTRTTRIPFAPFVATGFLLYVIGVSPEVVFLWLA